MRTTEMIIQFFKMYGWQLTVLATSGIVFLGFLKAFGTFNKVPDKAKKYLFYGISCALAILACTAYILIKDSFEWRSYLILIAYIVGYTSAIYTLYENTGIRDLLKKFIFKPIKNMLSKILQHIVRGTLSKDAVVELASEYGQDIAGEIIESVKEKELEKQQKQEEKEAKEGIKEEKKIVFPLKKTEQVEKQEKIIEESKVQKTTLGRPGMTNIFTPKR